MAIVEVWSSVLGVDDLATTDDLLARSTDQEAVIDAVSLINQRFAADLMLFELFELRTGEQLAAALRSRGVRAPAGVPPSRAVRGGSRSQRLWNATYRFADPRRAGDFDTAGWFAARAPVPMPDRWMREWLDTTVARLELLSPRAVLDVGCGSGMILSKLSPGCEHYVGVDFAEEAVARLRARIRADPASAHVDVLVADASRAAAAGDTPDLVILNSVVQYFPDRRYLDQTMAAFGAVLAPNGAVFLGDLHNRRLAFAERLSAHVVRAPVDVRADQLVDEVEQAVAVGAELALSVDDVVTLAPNLTCRALVRRGRFPTTMNRFRFDALLSAAPPAQKASEVDISWSAGTELTLGDADTMVVRSVPDARTIGFARLADELRTARPGATLADCRERVDSTGSIDPNALWTWGDVNGVGVAVAPGAAPGLVDVAFWRGRDEWAAAALLRGAVPESRDRSGAAGRS